MLNVNVKTDTSPVTSILYGAVGQVITTRGHIGSLALTTLTTTDDLSLLGVGPGSGVSVAMAGDPSTPQYFPYPTLRARVASISTTTITLDRPAFAGVSGVLVTVDDSFSIQAALDDVATSGGGTVTIPAGTYVIGAPDAPDNAPLFVGSDTIVAGAGRDQTILKLCDRAAQISVGVTSADSSVQSDAGYQYPCAALIVNSANIFWHHNESWDLMDPADDAPPDEGQVIQDLTLDGNCFNQPANNVGGDRSTLADVRTYALLTAVTITPPGSGALQNDHDYAVQVAYADSNGDENVCYHTDLVIPSSGSYGIQVTFNTPPAGAVAQYLYIRDQAVNPISSTWSYGTWTQGSNLLTAAVWRKIDLGGVQAPGSTYSITQYSPPVAPLSSAAAGDLVRTGSAVVATFGTAHSFAVGDVFNVSPGETFLPAGYYVVASVPSTTSISFASTGSAGSSTAAQTLTSVSVPRGEVASGGLTRSSSTVTATFTAPHLLSAGDFFTLSPGEADFPAGTYVVASAPSATTLTFASAGSAVSSVSLQRLAPNLYPPGQGGVGLGSATTSYGISLDNCSNVLCQRLKIVDMMQDGITLGNADFAFLAANPPHAATDVQIVDVQVAGCGRGALGITGPTQRVLFERVSCGDCYWGLDIECDAATGPIDALVFRSCRFAGSWRSPAVQLAAFENSPILGVLFTDCEFDDNLVHAAISTNEVCACFTRCRFTNASFTAIGCNAYARVFIVGNYFEFNGRETPPFPDGWTADQASGALIFGTPAATPSTIVVADNTFVGEPDYLAVLISVQSGHSVIIDHNDFRLAQRVAYQPASFSPNDPTPALQVLGEAVLTTNNNVGLYRLIS